MHSSRSLRIVIYLKVQMQHAQNSKAKIACFFALFFWSSLQMCISTNANGIFSIKKMMIATSRTSVWRSLFSLRFENAALFHVKIRL